MAIQFTNYPDSNRVPGIFVEMDPSQANTAQTLQRSLILGQKGADGSAEELKPIQMTSLVQSKTLFGRGSMLTQMAENYLAGDSFGDLWAVPIVDDQAAQAATGTVAFSGTVSQAGTVNLYIGGIRVRTAVNAQDSAATVGGAVRDTITANPDLAVTANGTGASITLTARNKGEAGNDIDLRLNYLGARGGEEMPAGLTAEITAMAGGTANPEIGDALAALSDQAFDFIVTPYTDTTNLDAMKWFLSDQQGGRWAWDQMIYGGGFSARRGTLGESTAFSLLRNDQHMAVMPYYDSPDPPWVWASQIGAYCAQSLRVDPGLPLQYITTRLKAPPIESRWTLGERNTLLYSGLSSTRVGDDDSVIIERMATTYQKNAAGATDDSYLDVETLYSLMFYARDLANYLLTRYARKKLVSDTTPIMAGSNTVNAPLIRASVISHYRGLETAGYVQDAATFAKTVVVENAGRGLVKVLAPVLLVQQLRQVAVLLQFAKP